MRFSRLLPVVLCFLITSACQSSKEAVYQPYKNGIGWSDVETGAERVAITYSAPVGTPFTLMKRMATIRAAEIARSRKSEHFEITFWEIVYIDGARVTQLDAKPAGPLSMEEFFRKAPPAADSLFSSKQPKIHRYDITIVARLNPNNATDRISVKDVLGSAGVYRK